MPETWANYGLDLHLDLAGAPRSRIRSGLEAALREAVRSGRLRAGARLPSSRDLATDLGIARNTVADAYGQLVAEGWLQARTGSGTWVTEQPARGEASGARPIQRSAPRRYDLRPGVPDISAFPRTRWLAAARSALIRVGDDALGYPDPRGSSWLRAAMAGYLSRARGVLADPENVIICAGFAHGLALIGQVLAARGVTSIATEAYGHPLYRRIARAQGLRVAPIRVDQGGAVATGLDDAGAGAVVLTPAHQYPLGMTLAPDRRTAFVRWAAGSGSVIIEDDYDGEFRFDRQPLGAMQALAPEHVIYAGTASKSLAPGLRLGWLVVPGPMVGEVIAAKERSGVFNGITDQLALASLIESGGYDRQIRQVRLAYRRRRDRLVAALARHVPEVRLSGIAAGMHAVAELPAGLSEEAVVAAAARHAVAVEGLAGYSMGDHERGPALVVGYGRPAEHAYTTAVSRLCAALAETCARPAATPGPGAAAPGPRPAATPGAGSAAAPGATMSR